MKKIMNLTNLPDDLQRFAGNADLKAYYRSFGLDGVELLQFCDDTQDTVRPEDVVGVHLKYLNYWVCVWNGDEQRVLDEFGSRQECEQALGGSRADIIQAFKDNLGYMRQFNPEYGVFHVSDISIQASMSWDFEYTDEQVIDATAELVNEVYDSRRDGFTLLFENLWWPGLNMRRPEMLKRLIDAVDYENCGVMLDIGHLLHTNYRLRTLDEGIDYIYSVLQTYGDLDFIKGIHLHQTLNGGYVQRMMNNPLQIEGSYAKRSMDILGHIFDVDKHMPFVNDRLGELIRHIDPEYLVFEFITESREQHSEYMRRQLACLDF